MEHGLTGSSEVRKREVRHANAQPGARAHPTNRGRVGADEQNSLYDVTPESLMAMNLRGRPPKYEDPDELQAKINEYFDSEFDKVTIVNKDGIERKVNRYTITGLCLYLGFSDRPSFYNYEKIPAFTHVIKQARLRIERHYETVVQTAQNSTGPIFIMKNMGWTDKSEVEQTFRVTQMPAVKLGSGEQLQLDVGDEAENVIDVAPDESNQGE